MKQNQLVGTGQKDAPMNEEIAQLKRKLDQLTGKVHTFEAMLKSQLASEIVEVQELSVLYKTQKKAKKQKQQEQKRRGKNYVEPNRLITQNRSPAMLHTPEEDLKEKKRLYREAMLHVHPDKFAMDNEKTDLATEPTTRLVAIYQHEDLEALKAFHAHLFCQKELPLNAVRESGEVMLSASPDTFLIQEKERLKQAIHTLKSKHTYHVLMNYRDPMDFVDELKAYYQDRIQKLRRRTRT